MVAKVKIDQTAKYLPFLVEIRRRLFFLIALFFVTSVLSFIYYEAIIRFVLKIFRFEGVNIVFTSPFQFINLAIQSSLVVGIVVILPVIIYQIVSFLKPALNKKEYKILLGLLPVSLILFLTGFVYGVVIMRYALQIFYQKSLELTIGNFLDVTTFLSQTLTTSIFLGIAFQFPIVLTFLLRTRVVPQEFFIKQRFFVHGFTLAFAALLPPTDLLSLLLLFLPLALLFELTLILNSTFFRPSLQKGG